MAHPRTSNIYAMKATKISARHSNPIKNKHPLEDAGQPRRKRVKVEKSMGGEDFSSWVPSSVIISSSLDTPASIIDYGKGRTAILNNIDAVVGLLKAQGRIAPPPLKQYITHIKNQVETQGNQVEKLVKKVEYCKALVEAREEQMDKMSTYMWPSQILNMYKDELDELVKERDRKRQIKDDARFEKKQSMGLASMPERSPRAQLKGETKLNSGPDVEDGEWQEHTRVC